ncbi:MAG: hypothetical protein IKB06_05550 [Clostridia bacterium]|nr:hypothetical protein [Clostridia bacterium]
MVLYLSVVFVAMALISMFNIALGSYGFNNYQLWVILAVIVSVVAEIAIQGLIAFIVNHLPKKWFAHDKKCFQVSKRERNFYEKIKIRSWKDKVWELGALGGFRKNKIADPTSPDYLLQFIVESNIGVVAHLVGIFFGFAVIFILPLEFAFKIGVPVALVNLLLCSLPTMILRYNIPKLKVAYERARRTKELEAKKKVESEKNSSADEPKTATANA